MTKILHLYEVPISHALNWEIKGTLREAIINKAWDSFQEVLSDDTLFRELDEADPPCETTLIVDSQVFAVLIRSPKGE